MGEINYIIKKFKLYSLFKSKTHIPSLFNDNSVWCLVCVSVDSSFQFTVSFQRIRFLTKESYHIITIIKATIKTTTACLWTPLDNAAFHPMSAAYDNSSSVQLNVEGY